MQKSQADQNPSGSQSQQTAGQQEMFPDSQQQGAASPQQEAPGKEEEGEQQESPPSEPEQKPRESLKAKVSRIRRGADAPEGKKEDDAGDGEEASKKSVERIEKKVAEIESESAKRLEKLKALDEIDKKVNEEINLRQAKERLPGLLRMMENFDDDFPAPHPSDFKTGTEYEKAVRARAELKRKVCESALACDMLVNPGNYKAEAGKASEADGMAEEFEAEVKEKSQRIPNIGETAKVFGGMSDYQKGMIMGLPQGTRSLVTHCIGTLFKPGDMAKMSKAEFAAQFDAAKEFVYAKMEEARAAQPPQQEQSSVKAPPKMSEAAPPMERKESLRDRIARLNKGYYRG